MRLSYVLLVAAAAVVVSMDSTSAASVTTLSKLSTANAVVPTYAHERIGNDRRLLRKYQVVEGDDDNEEEEERGWLESQKILVRFGFAHLKNDMDEMQKILREVNDASTIKALYAKVEPLFTKHFNGYDERMGLERFQDMLDKTAGLSDDMKGMLTSAYSKYYTTTHFQ